MMKGERETIFFIPEHKYKQITYIMKNGKEIKKMTLTFGLIVVY
jgi:hypothetical protein